MDPLVVALLLAASLLHATWHALVKTSGDRVVALAGMNAVSGALALALLPAAGWLAAPAYALLAFSVLLHAGYKLALARLYRVSDLGQAYPLARGFTPLVAAALAFVAMGEAPGGAALCGLLLVSLGILALGFERGANLRRPSEALGMAFLTGALVACYSVVDAYGVRWTGNWLAYTVWLVCLDSLAFVGYALATRGAAALQAWRAQPGRVIASGALGIASFGIFMWALGVAPVGLVAALRETSVLFAALIGALALGERAGALRYGAAAAVACGVGLIALAR
jgi:drug/metabolite transporter (DMT)-like permease